MVVTRCLGFPHLFVGGLPRLTIGSSSSAA
jgi:hypothetical protein